MSDLSFTALPGETIALVGATGAGKSTALALLHRAFDPQSGAILVDGMDVRGLKLAELRRNIGVVYQEVLLFNRSIAENLRVGKPDATLDEMREACARAQALEFIERQPDGFDAPIGERGRFLSGGERQRLVDRPRAAEKPADPDPRRGDQRARRGDRGQGAGCARRGDEEPHDVRDRAPASTIRNATPDPGVRGRPHRRGRHLRRARRPRRPLRGAGKGAVSVAEAPAVAVSAPA